MLSAKTRSCRISFGSSLHFFYTPSWRLDSNSTGPQPTFFLAKADLLKTSAFCRDLLAASHDLLFCQAPV